MWVVVGLGNHGDEYEGTRHNLGFEVVRCLAGRHGFPQERRRSGAAVTKGCVGGQDVVLVQPQTYMNRSGDAVSAILHFYHVQPGELVVVHDDLDFDPGQVRVKLGGGDGGHKGLQSVIGHVGPDFVRVRMGIGKAPPSMEGSDYVLSRFDRPTRKLMDEAVQTGADVVERVIERGAQAAMQEFNRREKETPPPASDAPNRSSDD